MNEPESSATMKRNQPEVDELPCIVGHLWRLWQRLDGATDGELLTDEEVQAQMGRLKHTHAASCIRECAVVIEAEYEQRTINISSPYFESLAADAESWRRQKGLGYAPPPPRPKAGHCQSGGDLHGSRNAAGMCMDCGQKGEG